MKSLNIFRLMMAAGCLAVAGCEQPMARPPVSLAEYQRLSPPNAYPLQTIVMHNMVRVLDNDLPTPQRLESFRLVAQIGDEDASARKQLAAVLSQPNVPPELYQAVLTYLLRKDHPDMAAIVVQALPNLGQQESVRESLLEWLSRHPQPAVMSEIVKLWATEPVQSPTEHRYRQVIERISGKAWADALLDSINTSEFFARGSALEILIRRVPATQLRQMILQTPPRSDAMFALQTFLARMDYMPANAQEFLAEVYLYMMRRDAVNDVAELWRRWHTDYDYRFNIRDFHLMSQLARDPVRSEMRRGQLALDISNALAAHSHVRHKAAGGELYPDNFNAQVDNLSIIDLWNIYLLNEMLNRPRVQAALRIKADRSGGNYANWGGLVFYENRQADAKLYPPQSDHPTEYIVSRRLIADSRDSLCRFQSHFEQAENSLRAGPDADELRDARQGGHYGLILTSVGNDAFCGHYYNPRGIVVSLGKYPFRN